MHQAVGFDLRQQIKLRIDHGDAGKIEIVVAQFGEDLAEPCGGVGLKAGRADVAQHCVVAGFVGLVERQQRRSDQDQHAVAIDLRGFRRLR